MKRVNFGEACHVGQAVFGVSAIYSWRLLRLAAIIGASMTVQSVQAQETPKDGGELSVALEVRTFVCLDPWQISDTAPLNMLRQLVETLTWNDPATGELKPWLAESWEEKDSTEFTFTLKKGVTFADGSPLTPAAVVANWNAIKNMGPLAQRAFPFLSRMKSAEALDDRRVRITLDAPNAGFLRSTASIFQAIVSPATNAKTPEQRCADGVIGSGPFVTGKFAQGQEMTLVRRDEYNWGPAWASHTGPAYLEKLHLLFVPEASARLGMLTSGQVGIVQAISTQSIATAKKAGAQIINRSLPGMPLRFNVNTQRGPLGEKAVRQAITHGINRKEINDVIYDSMATVATGALVVGTGGYSDMSALMTYDPKKAAKLLDDAGWAVKSDGIRVKDGKRLTATLTFLSVYAENQPAAELLQQQMRAIGIDLVLEKIMGTQYLPRLPKHEYDIVYINGTATDADIMRDMLSPNARNTANIEKDDPLAPLLEAQRTAPSGSARKEILDQIQKIVLQEGYDIPIIEVPQFFAVSPKVKGARLDIETRLIAYDMWLAK